MALAMMAVDLDVTLVVPVVEVVVVAVVAAVVSLTALAAVGLMLHINLFNMQKKGF